jgi:lipoprotein-releasing system ATP-binding protein
MIEVKAIKKHFGKVEVLKGIDLKIEKGQEIAIQGSSGSGKSTLLYLMGGLDRPSSGAIFFNGEKLNAMSDEDLALFRNQNIGFVFQFHFLLPSMNCLDNILLPARIGAAKIKEVKKEALLNAELLGVTHCLKKFPHEISGGEQQRINILRAISLKPQILLCDEPTGNLDSKNSKIVIDLLRNISKKTKATLIVVTHDANIASQLPSKITIEDGQIIS